MQNVLLIMKEYLKMITITKNMSNIQIKTIPIQNIS